MLLCATRAADEADDTEEADGDGVDALVDWLEDDVGGPVDLAAAAGYAAAEAAEAAAAAFVPVASSVRVDEEGWAAAARLLEHNGFAVVRRGADGTPLVRARRAPLRGPRTRATRYAARGGAARRHPPAA